MSKQAPEFSIEYRALADVVRWPRNPKKHDEDNIDASINRFGFVQPLLYDETSLQLVAGHGRLESLQRRQAKGEEPPKRIRVLPNGDWAVPVIRGVGFDNINEAEAFLVADNRLVELGGWDEDNLLSILKDLQDIGDHGLDGLGFDAAMLTQALNGVPVDQDIGVALTGTQPNTQGTLVDENTVKEKLKTVSCPHCGNQVPV